MVYLTVLLIVTYGAACFHGFDIDDEILTDDESRLFAKLFKNYRINREVRPVRNKSSAVLVTLDLAYSQLVDLVSALSTLITFL